MRNVRFWHLAEVQTALMNVRFEGNNGHDADVTRCLLMTHSGHCCACLIGMVTGYDWRGPAACVALALWPERCTGLVSVNS